MLFFISCCKILEEAIIWRVLSRDKTAHWRLEKSFAEKICWFFWIFMWFILILSCFSMYRTYKLKIRYPCFGASAAANKLRVLPSRWQQWFENVSANQLAYQYTSFPWNGRCRYCSTKASPVLSTLKCRFCGVSICVKKNRKCFLTFHRKLV